MSLLLLHGSAPAAFTRTGTFEVSPAGTAIPTTGGSDAFDIGLNGASSSQVSATDAPAAVADGTFAAKITIGASAVQNWRGWTYNGQKVFTRQYIYIPAFASQVPTICSVRQTGGVMASVRLHANATLGVIIGGVNSQGTVTLPTATLIRIEATFDAAAGTLTADWYLGHSATSQETLSVSSTYSATTINNVIFGVTNSAALSWTLYQDAIGIASDARLGPIQTGVTADVDLSGSGTLTATATPALTASAALSGSGTTTQTTSRTLTASAALSGTGTVTQTTSRSLTQPAGLSGSGTLTATSVPASTQAVALSGSGTLTQTSVSGQTKSAALSGSGTLTATGVPSVTQSAGTSGSGTLSQSATPSLVATAGLSGAGTLSATATPALAVSAALSGSGTLSANTATSATAALSGTGTLTATAYPLVLTFEDGTNGAFVVAGGPISATSGPMVYASSAAVHGALGITATTTAFIKVSKPADFPANGEHTGSFYIRPRANAGVGQTIHQLQSAGNAGMGNLALLSSAGTKFAAFNDAGTQTATTLSWSAGTVYRIDWYYSGDTTKQLTYKIFAGANSEGNTPDATVTVTNTLARTFGLAQFLTGLQANQSADIDTIRLWPGQVTVTPYGTLSASAGLSGTGTLTATVSRTLTASVALSGSGTLTVATTLSLTQSAALSGDGTLTATSALVPHVTVDVELSGTGTLFASVGTAPFYYPVDANLGFNDLLATVTRVTMAATLRREEVDVLVAPGQRIGSTLAPALVEAVPSGEVLTAGLEDSSISATVQTT